MFLYSLLNDKHSELTDLAADLSGLKTDIEAFGDKTTEIIKEQTAAFEKQEVVEEPVKILEEPEAIDASLVRNHNEMILDAYKAGQDEVTIARSLGLGIGEVRLVIDLYKGESKNEV